MSARRPGRALVSLVVLLWAIATTAVAATPAAPAAWEQWLHLPGVFDLAGPRGDGLLVAAVHTRLVLISTSGQVSDFAPAYSAPDGSESYIALSSGLAVDGAGCSFTKDDVFALDLKRAPPGIAKIGAGGAVSRFATVNGVTTLSAIAFDTVGDFGHRLLVIGPFGQGRSLVAAIDCAGNVMPVGTVPTSLEGGIAVAPRGFGPFGGQLIAPNEGNGSVYAVSPRGGLQQVAASGVPAGGDIGVESVGVVPVSGATAAYTADRGTPGNPHPGTDSVLRLGGTALSAAGVRAGDVLVATEGGDTVVDVHCTTACVATVVATGPPTAHGEGRLLVVAAPPMTPSAPGGSVPALQAASAADQTDHRAAVVTVAAGGAVVIGAGLLAVILLRRKRGGP